jgi:hypothetical protein
LRPATAYLADDGAAYERFLGRWTGQLATALIDFVELPGDGPVLEPPIGGSYRMADELELQFIFSIGVWWTAAVPRAWFASCLARRKKLNFGQVNQRRSSLLSEPH